MKNALYLFALSLLFVACKNDVKPVVETSSDIVEGHLVSMEGVWELVSYYNYSDNEVMDTVIATPENRQVKIYTNSKVMWSRMVPRDSTEFFGYGAYVITDSTLIETLEYGSSAMLNVIDTMRVFSFELLKSDDSYSQIDIGPEGDRIFSENYIRIKD